MADLRFRHAILDCLDAIATRESAPRSRTERLQDDIRIKQYGAAMACHPDLEVDRLRDSVRRKQIGHVVNGETKQSG